MPSPRKRQAQLTPLGWREWVLLPELGLPALKAKVDTGARTSSLHATDLEPFDRDGREWVRFLVHPRQRSRSRAVCLEAPLVERRSVRPSTGDAELRPVIRTRALVAGVRFNLELTLTDRAQMGFRMLLGREALRRRFLVDAGRSFLGGTPAPSNDLTPPGHD
ncbi:MAG: ATP-dependent zinc protease family protein [Planctomycetota bacterium]|jgi:hypothetical protein